MPHDLAVSEAKSANEAFHRVPNAGMTFRGVCYREGLLVRGKPEHGRLVKCGHEVVRLACIAGRVGPQNQFPHLCFRHRFNPLQPVVACSIAVNRERRKVGGRDFGLRKIGSCLRNCTRIDCAAAQFIAVCPIAGLAAPPYRSYRGLSGFQLGT
jgi:hypothetical protein